MKLLIITQKIDRNDDILGFFHRWVEEFAKKCESVIVICLEKGEYKLPKNVKVLSLGKEFQIRNPKSEIRNPEGGRQGGPYGAGKFKIQNSKFKILERLKYLFRFYKYIWQERKNYDAVFVHMNPEYAVLGGLLWKLMGKKVGLWYVHKTVNLKLRVAAKLVDKIFTASAESCRLKSDKIVITGHGIDIQKFEIRNPKFETNSKFKILNSKFRIISVGRIAPVKNLDILIKAAEILKNKGLNFEVKIAGAPVLESDKIYFNKLEELVKEKNLESEIKFIGPIPYKDIAEFYQQGNLFVNFSDTGSLDKAVLEAMASGLLILTSNEAFKDILAEKYFTNKDPQQIAGKIIQLSESDKDPALRDYVVKHHSLENLIEKIFKIMANDNLKRSV
jgi:glycosyltransferase involved in cell wall biosynthesis